MEYRLPAYVVVSAETLPEAMAIVAPAVEDLDQYTPSVGVELIQGDLVPVGEG